MRSVRNLVCLFLAAAATLAQEGGQKVIELADINRDHGQRQWQRLLLPGGVLDAGRRPLHAQRCGRRRRAVAGHRLVQRLWCLEREHGL